MEEFKLIETISLNEEQKLVFRLTGDEMTKEKGYPLHEVLAALSTFEKMVNKTYLHLNNKERFVDSDRDNISIRLLDVKEGSFWSELNIVYSSVIVPAVPIILDNKDLILGIIKKSYEFIKVKTKAEKEGKTVEINQDSSTDAISVVNNGPGNVTINVQRGIPEATKEILPEIKRMANIVDQQNVNTIEILECDSEDMIIFDEEGKNILKSTTYTQDDEFEIFGKIIDGNYLSQNGKMEVKGTMGIPDGIYSFKVEENLKSEEVWKQLFLEEREYLCKLRIEITPSLDNSVKIKQLIVTDWIDRKAA